MQIDLNIQAEDIEKQLVEAIVSSGLGAKVKEICDAELKELSGYSSPLKTAIKKSIADIVYKIVQTECMDAIEKTVRENMPDEIVAELAIKAWNSLRNGAL